MRFRYVAALVMAGAIGLGLPAHAASKAEQCSSLADSLNRIEPTTDKLGQGDFEKKIQAASEKKDLVQTQSLFREYAAAIRGVAKDMTGLNTEIGGIPLQDVTLAEIKNQYLQVLVGLTRELDSLASTVDIIGNSRPDTPQGLAEFRKALNSLDDAERRVKRLTQQGKDADDRFNAYCGAR